MKAQSRWDLKIKLRMEFGFWVKELSSKGWLVLTDWLNTLRPGFQFNCFRHLYILISGHIQRYWFPPLPPTKSGMLLTSVSIYVAAAKSLQSSPTLCDPIDSSLRGSPVPGILQARTLEWVAISFSNAGKWKVRVKRPHGLQPTRLLHLWDFPGKSTGVGCHCLLLSYVFLY